MSVELPNATPDNDRLVGLLFELASQLHAERARRIALECALEEAGSLPAGWMESWQGGECYNRLCQEALDDSMSRLMQIMAESADPRTPLRREAAGFEEL